LVRACYFLIIYLFYFCTNSCFAYKLDSGHKEVQQRAQGAIDIGECVTLRLRREAIIAHKVSDAGEVFLLDETVVVFAISPRLGKLDALVLAPFEKGGIDEFGAVVAVYA